MALDTLTRSAIADVSLPFAPPQVSEFDDVTLLSAQRELSEIRRRVDSAAAAIASEVSHRSRPELGYDGLAQRLGARSPQQLIQQVTGSSTREAHTLVRAGTMITTPAENPTPWLHSVGAALASGSLSIDAADAIRSGLGTPDDDISPAALAVAAEALLLEASSMTLERLAARARDLRADLDLSRVATRENELRERRYLHLIPQGDGMTRLSGLLDPESAAIVTSAFDSVTSPRRGGPRFVDARSTARAQRIADDDRTTGQLALDAFVELLRIGDSADETILGNRRPAVQVLVTADDLRTGRGIARDEGSREAISVATAARHICSAGTVPVQFDTDGQVLNVGRDQRLFTHRQRIGLAARDGGCRFPGCDRPPSWTEAHHINEWYRDGGRTDLIDGILLCRHHHLLVHNNGWKVTRSEARYFVVPPPSIDPQQVPIPAPPRSAAVRRLAGVAMG